MSRRTTSALALLVLLALTGVTWLLVERSGGAIALAAVSLAKALLVLFVFLELDHTWWVWTALAVASVAGVLGVGAALLVG